MNLKMTKHLTLLLFIGLAWGQDKTSVSSNDGTFVDIEELNKEKLSIRERAIIDAKNDANNWVLYPPAAFLTFGAIMLGSEEEPWEYFPATLGISAASLTIPYLFFRELTWKNTENFNSKDKKLYEKVYSKEFRKRKSTIIVFSSVATGVLGPLLYISAVVSGLS
jgi:hypothetical protein